jgi:hypothetical protein
MLALRERMRAKQIDNLRDMRALEKAHHMANWTG